MKTLPIAVALLSAFSIGANAATISFNPFVSSSSISAVEGQNNTIGFTYAGNKFVGSVYFGANNAQLYSTDLTGGNVQQFGSPIPTANAEVVLAASLGKGGFPTGDIYTGSEANGNIYHIANGGGAATLFATGLTGGVRGILFDPDSTFGGDMLVTTSEDTEGMDIATSAWGPFAGYVLVDSEASGNLRLISPTGAITLVGSVPAAETVSFVPLNLGVSGNSLEGFYVANYPVDVQFADASQFAGLQGDAVITSEDPSSARLWDVHYDSGSGTFSITQLGGHLPNQSEDGVFVTAQRIIDVSSPEPSTLLLAGGGMLIAGLLRRKRRA